MLSNQSNQPTIKPFGDLIKGQQNAVSIGKDITDENIQNSNEKNGGRANQNSPIKQKEASTFLGEDVRLNNQRDTSPTFGGGQQNSHMAVQSPTDLIQKRPATNSSPDTINKIQEDQKNPLSKNEDAKTQQDSDAQKRGRTKKKKPAKDDFSQARWGNFATVSFPLNNNLFESNDQSPSYRPNAFAENILYRNKQEVSGQKQRKRRKSAHSLKSRQDNTKQNLFQNEEDNEDFDLAQSLLTLQINHRYTRPMQLQKIGSQSPLQANLRWKTCKNDVYLKGLPGERTNNHKENIARRMSNYAYAQYVEDTQLNLEDNPEQQKDEQQTEIDDDEQNISLKSVSLQDQELEGLSAFDMDSGFSLTAIDGRVQEVIKETVHRSLEFQDQIQPEEYESLVWGQSIWSTDVMRESKKQFIKNYQHLTSSDMNQQTQNTAENPSEQEECSFDVIQKTIQQETQECAMEPQVFQRSEMVEQIQMQQYQTKMLAMTVQNEQLEQMQKNSSQMNLAMSYQNDAQQNQQNQFQIQQQLHFCAQTQQNAPGHVITSAPATPGGPQQTEDPHVLNPGPQAPGVGNDFINSETNPFYNSIGQKGYNEYKAQQEQPQAPSVHSGGPAAFTGQASVGVNDLGAEYPGDTSSNYTHHPYSQYGAASQQQISANQQPNAPNFYLNQSPHPNSSGYSMKQQNQRPHIFINRAINKYMMNPIYKSKNTITALQMNRYSVLPWRGSSNLNNINMNRAQNQPVQPQNFPLGDYQYMLAEQDAYQQLNTQTQYQQYLLEQKGDSAYAQQAYANHLDNSQGQNQRYPPPEDMALDKDSEHGTKVALDAKPFYPKNYGEQRFQQQQVHESAKLLAAGNTRNMHNLRPKAPAIHVPVPIPIMRRGLGPKHKVHGGETDNQGLNVGNQLNQNGRQSIFMSQIFARKIELDQRMKETTQNLEQKISKAAEFNDEEDNDEEEDVTFEVTSAVDPSEISTERPESSLNKSPPAKDIKNQLGTAQVTIKNLRPSQRKNSDAQDQVNSMEENKLNYYESKIKRKNDRAAIFKKLQEQLKEFKSEMHATQDPSSAAIGHNNAASISPKRSQDLFNDPEKNKEHSIDLKNQARLTPFRQDAKQYMDKVLNLMNIINEVDGLTNVAELKNKFERQKLHILKARAERDELQVLLKQVQQQYHYDQQKLIDKEKSYQDQLSDSQALVQSLNQNLQNLNEQNEFTERQIRQQLQQIDQVGQENHDLIMQNQQLQEIQKSQYQQIQSFNQQKDQLVFNSHNQLQKQNNQMEQIQQNNFQLQQKLNQLQIENQQLQLQINKYHSETMKNEDEGGQRLKQMKDNETNDHESVSEMGTTATNDEIPLEEQLRNASKQIKDLQDYIKKRGLEDMKNNAIRQENFQKNEKAHLERFNAAKKQREDVEREKDRIIHRLKDFIVNHNESILLGSVGSSMIGGEERKDGLRENNEPIINDASTIDARSSNFMDSFDKHDNEDIIRAIMTDYSCEKCDEKERVIENNEQRINDYIQYIKKQSMQRAQVQNQPKTTADASCQTDKIQEVAVADQQAHNLSNLSGSMTSGIIDQSMSPLKASHKLLLNNYVRQVKDYLDNIEDQEAESTEKIKLKLNTLAQAHRITLFDEEEQPDPSIITQELIQDIMSMSVDMISDLLSAATTTQSSKNSLQRSELGTNSQSNELTSNVTTKIVEKIVEKVVIEFKTVEFGLSIQDLKDMQNVARGERKACHHIIVEIEKLMYEMNSRLGKDCQEPQTQEETLKVFTQIMDTYLQLPHRLKPIFDHCKKIETCLMKALKKQEEILASQNKDNCDEEESKIQI